MSPLGVDLELPSGTFASGAAAFTRTSKLTGLFTIMILDMQNPERPEEVGRWWIPGQWQAGGEVFCQQHGAQALTIVE